MCLRVVVTGAAGRLGAAMCAELASAGYQVVALTRADLDISSAGQVARAMEQLQPQVIVNCAAYNAVDAAETNAAAAFAINAGGPAWLARAATTAEAMLIHYGTDFVFDGAALQPYSEVDHTNPLSVYGASKLAGENEVRRTPHHYILRVASLFGGCGVKEHRATVDFIADTLSGGGRVRALVDRTVTPSYVPDVVEATRGLIERRAPYGTYHCVNSGAITWYGLASEVARRLAVAGPIEPVTVAELKTVAPRPRFGALSNQKLLAAGIAMPAWQCAIRRHVAERAARVPAQAVAL